MSERRNNRSDRGINDVILGTIVAGQIVEIKKTIEGALIGLDIHKDYCKILVYKEGILIFTHLSKYNDITVNEFHSLQKKYCGKILNKITTEMINDKQNTNPNN